MCIKSCILYTKNITICHFKPITDPKTHKKRVIQINKQIWDFLPCAHLLCLYTALRHS